MLCLPRMVSLVGMSDACMINSGRLRASIVAGCLAPEATAQDMSRYVACVFSSSPSSYLRLPLSCRVMSCHACANVFLLCGCVFFFSTWHRLCTRKCVSFRASAAGLSFKPRRIWKPTYVPCTTDSAHTAATSAAFLLACGLTYSRTSARCTRRKPSGSVQRARPPSTASTTCIVTRNSCTRGARPRPQRAESARRLSKTAQTGLPCRRFSIPVSVGQCHAKCFWFSAHFQRHHSSFEACAFAPVPRRARSRL